MDRYPVKSSNIATIGYDRELHVLEIEFLNGKIYEYYDVPELVHQQLINAESPGGYFFSNIMNIYGGNKIQ